MNGFSKMLERANIQMVADMIQMGAPKLNLDVKNLEEREDEVTRQLKERLRKSCPGKSLAGQ